ncbi:hypothetical protein L0156_20940 [bacterium]|nr:hypothetical protein [bacterium]
MKNLLIFIFAVSTLFAIAAVTASGQAAELDGKSYLGETAEKGKTSGNNDELIFADGKFHSTGCDQYGFTPAPYTTKTQGDTTTFESVAKSEKEGEISWNGTVQGDTCEAAFVWTKPGQKPIEYWFKGSLKKAP